MGRRPWIVVALAAVLAAMLVPGSAVSVVQHSDDGDSAEFDVRTGVAAPTAAQRAAVKRLGATVIWNRFGTPASLSKRGKFLATGMRGANAVAAARAWLNANKAILGLSSTPASCSTPTRDLSASNGHAVNFRQVFDGLEAAEGGLVTVGITGSAAKRWRVAYVSSSLYALDVARIAARSSSRLPRGWRTRRRPLVTASRSRRSPRPRTPPATSPSRLSGSNRSST